jgi:hypothetical protein
MLFQASGIILEFRRPYPSELTASKYVVYFALEVRESEALADFPYRRH